LLEFLAENEDTKNDENKSRNLLIQLNLYGGVKNLSFLSITDIKNVLERINMEII
jgi:Family of unknown function (DUF6339)